MAKRQNWGKYQTWHPSKIIYPSSLEELKQAVLGAKASGSKIRVAGRLHTMNDLCNTPFTQIHMDKLSEILMIDKEKREVKVQGGATLKKILPALAKEGLTLPNQGYIIEQTIAGAAATATHGSGMTGTICSFILKIELVDSFGKLIDLSPEKEGNLFSAAVTGLGALGVVYSLTLQCIPLTKLILTKVKSTREDILRDLPRLLKQPYFQFMLDPYSNDGIIWEYRQTNKEIQGQWRYALKWAFVKTLATLAFDILPMPSWLVPLFIKIFMRFSQLKSVVDYSYRLLSPADEGHYIEEEIALPLENFEKALSATQKIIDRYRARGKTLVAVILLRFAGPDPYGALSPALGRKTAYISLITIAKQGWRDLFREIEEELYQYEGRPHWGKIHSLTRDKIERLYKDNFQKFLDAKNKIDPEGLFMNESLNKLFLK